MEFIIALQPPYSLLVGFDTYLDKEQTDLGYKSIVLHFLLLSIEIKYDHDEQPD
jgi:hypothetical protein